MRMQIDQPGCDQFPFGVDGTLCECGIDRCFNCCDLSVSDAHVANATQRLTRIDDLAAADHQIEGLRCIAKCWAIACYRGGGECRRSDQEVTT
jgi:hypothetical protein